MDLPCPEQLIPEAEAAERRGPPQTMPNKSSSLFSPFRHFSRFIGPEDVETLTASAFRTTRIFALGILAVFITAAAQPPPLPSPTPSQTDVVDLVHFGDLIDVDFAGGFEFDWRGGLTPEGFLDGLDNQGDRIYALCRSEKEIAADIVKIYGRILRDPKVEVKILDRSNRAVVRLSGAVKFSQRFQIKRTVHLRELLIIAGGVTDETSGEITIFRPGNLSCGPGLSSITTGAGPASIKDNGSQMINIKISELLSGVSASDPVILSGDIITVEKAMPIYIIGAVGNPRQIFSRSQITVTRAIASAGGLIKDALGDEVTIFRREKGGSHVVSINLTKVKNGEMVDEVLKPFDIIDVPRKGAARRQFPPILDVGSLNDPRSTNPPLRIID